MYVYVYSPEYKSILSNLIKILRFKEKKKKTKNATWIKKKNVIKLEYYNYIYTK